MKSHHIFTKEKLFSQHSKSCGTEVHASPKHPHKSKSEQQRAQAICCKSLDNLARRWTAPYKPSFQLPRVPGLDSGSHGLTQLNVLTCYSHAMPWDRRETSTSTLYTNYSYINKLTTTTEKNWKYTKKFKSLTYSLQYPLWANWHLVAPINRLRCR
jgi:hypothetical protein